jgi:hypothetical protein
MSSIIFEDRTKGRAMPVTPVQCQQYAEECIANGASLLRMAKTWLEIGLELQTRGISHPSQNSPSSDKIQ